MPLRFVKRLLARWTREQETALRRLTGGRTLGRRLAGFNASERVDAKFLLVAMAPWVPLLVSDRLGWSRGLPWVVWLWLSAAWSTVIAGICLAAYWRVIRGPPRRDR